jgi:hypothetical protein
MHKKTFEERFSRISICIGIFFLVFLFFGDIINNFIFKYLAINTSDYLLYTIITASLTISGLLFASLSVYISLSNTILAKTLIKNNFYEKIVNNIIILMNLFIIVSGLSFLQVLLNNNNLYLLILVLFIYTLIYFIRDLLIFRKVINKNFQEQKKVIEEKEKEDIEK